jgi:Xaa-Pro aminopeptidase
MVRSCFNATTCSSVAPIFLTDGIFDRAEPGYYADGKWGIRIENVVIVRKAATKYNFGDVGYLSFEHVTLVCHLLFFLVRCRF